LADTKGLLSTRKLYMDALEAGETDLDHKAWYEQLMQQKAAEAADAQKGFDSAQAPQNPKG
jgi:hypothetical protein